MQQPIPPAFALEDQLSGEEDAALVFARDLLRETLALGYRLGADAHPVIRRNPHPARQIRVLLQSGLRLLAHVIHLFHALERRRIDDRDGHEDDVVEVAREKLHDGE